MADLPPPTLRLRIDEGALAANWRTLDAMSGAATAGAAVKANAYGLGVDRVMPALLTAGARDFYVAHWGEVPEVARHVTAGAISVLHGVLTPADAAFAREIGARPVINSLHQAQIWLTTGGGVCDLMVDTGINRLGLAMDDIGDPLLAQLEVDMLLSHLASADEDVPLNTVQLDRFRIACGAIPARRRSLANSAGIALGADFAFDGTRPGLSLYGGIPRAELEDRISQVAFPQAAVMQIRTVQAGDSIGYNATYTAERRMRVGVVSLGYADGFLRCRGPGGALLHNTCEVPVLGRVSMDMVVVDLSAAQGIKEGDWLNVPMDLSAAAAQSGLSQYELLTVLGRRFS